MYTLNCNGRLLDLSTPKIMGILNVTPDSFYEGSRSRNESVLLEQATFMLEEGAAILDIGGYSSRPGADDVPVEEELKRVTTAISAVIKEFPKVIISVDTFRSDVAKAAVIEGASIINDISGGQLDDNMMDTAASFKTPYICMHMRGTPQNMTSLNQYDDLLKELLKYFSERLALARKAGINDFIADPGFGFAKNISQNFELMSKLEVFQALEVPLLVGISRKSMIYKTLNTSANEALNGTTALNSIALLKGANILRVHDVKEAVECVKLIGMLPTEGNL